MRTEIKVIVTKVCLTRWLVIYPKEPLGLWLVACAVVGN